MRRFFAAVLAVACVTSVIGTTSGFARGAADGPGVGIARGVRVGIGVERVCPRMPALQNRIPAPLRVTRAGTRHQRALQQSPPGSRQWVVRGNRARSRPGYEPIEICAAGRILALPHRQFVSCCRPLVRTDRRCSRSTIWSYRVLDGTISRAACSAALAAPNTFRRSAPALSGVLFCGRRLTSENAKLVFGSTRTCRGPIDGDPRNHGGSASIREGDLHVA